MKRFGRTIFGISFKLLLLTLPLVTAISIVFGTPKYIKQSLDDNDVYQKALDGIIEQIEKSAVAEGESTFPFADPGIQQAIKDAFPASTLQNAGESVLNGAFSWLSGDTDILVFEIDLTTSKQKLADGIAAVAAARLQSLPTCTYAQMRILDVNNIDPFTVPCRPSNFDIATQQQSFRDKIATSTDFLPQTVLTADELPKNDNGKTVVEQLGAAPTVFQIARSTPFIVGLLTILSAVAWIWLFDSKRRGLVILSYVVIAAGIFVLVIFGIFSWLLEQANSTGGLLANLNSSDFTIAITNVATDLATKTNRILLWFGVVYLLIGGIGWLALKFTTKSNGPKPIVKPRA